MAISTMTPEALHSSSASIEAALPKHRDLYYGGAWHAPLGGYRDTYNPATGESLGPCAEANADDVEAAVCAASAAFPAWRRVKPLERAAALSKIAAVLRGNVEELALIDAANCGNPIRALRNDVINAAAQLDYFAGLATEAKGSTIPVGPDILSMTVREPLGVCARIVAYNHPLMFLAAKMGAPLVTGNVVIMKPPPQAPLSAYRFLELIDGILPPGVLNILTGGVECGSALVAHPDIPVVTLIGSVSTGQQIAKAGGERLKRVILELGGKNALIVYPDADVQKAVDGAIRGMNFTWCGQSCGSTSRLFIHESLYDEVLSRVVEASKSFRPGIPTDPQTSMGALISKAHFDRVLSYIEAGKAEGAKLLTGGKAPDDPQLANGFFIEPTIFGDVTMDMRIAREEIFGPVLSVIRWSDEDAMFGEVNALDYGLTASIFTTSLTTAHRAAARVEAGFVWINTAASHFLGVPFGGWKQSGIGREESLDELHEFTQLKAINIAL